MAKLTALPEGNVHRDDGRYFVEVPEIGSQEIAGEWLIPNDGILLVSFGPHTVADKDGKAVIRERLAIVEAEEADGGAAAPDGAVGHVRDRPPSFALPTSRGAADALRRRRRWRCRLAVPRPRRRPAMPPLPSRSIPQGYHSDGKAAACPRSRPTRPDDDEAEIRRAPPQPADEGPAAPAEVKHGEAAASADTAMKKAQFTLPNFPVIPSLFQAAPVDRLAVPAADQARLVQTAFQPAARDRDLRPGRPHPRAGRSTADLAPSRRDDHEVGTRREKKEPRKTRIYTKIRK